MIKSSLKNEATVQKTSAEDDNQKKQKQWFRDANTRIFLLEMNQVQR